MDIRKLIEEKIYYRFFGCFYTRFYGPLFDFIESKIPQEFLGREISDLGCGDGTDTLRLKRIFKATNIMGYDYTDSLLERANKKGIRVQKFNLSQEIPRGEMATSIMFLHHIQDKEKVLRNIIQNFDYLFLVEPILSLFHKIFHEPGILTRNEWIDLFDKILKRYTLYQFSNKLIVFWKRD